MDMWEPYVQSRRAHLPEADTKIVFEKFHVVQHLREAVDHVRRGEHRALKTASYFHCGGLDLYPHETG